MTISNPGRDPGTSRRAVIVLLAAGGIFHAWLISRFAMTLPMWDDWIFPPIWHEFAIGGNWIELISRPFRGIHYMVFPYLIFLGDAVVFGWNLRLLMYVSLALLLATAWILLRGIPLNRSWVDVIALFLAAVLLFSLRQVENVLWSWQMAIHLTQFSGVVAFYCLGRRQITPRIGALALLCTVVGTFSFSTGIAIWPVTILQLLARGAHRRQRWFFGIWCITFLATLWIFLRPSVRTGAPSLSRGATVLIEFVLTFLGSPFCSNERALYFGALLLGLMAVLVPLLIRNHALQSDAGVSIWVWLCLYGLVTGITVALGRSYLGPTGALLSRYATLSLPFSLGAVVILATAAAGWRPGPSLPVVRWLIAALLLVLIVASLRESTSAGRLVAQWDPIWRVMEREFYKNPRRVTLGQMMGILHNDPKELAAGMRLLETLRWGPFKNPAHTAESSSPWRDNVERPPLTHGACSDHAAIDVSRRTPHRYFQIEGWAGNPATGVPAQDVILICGGTIVERSLHGIPRPDVSAFFKSQRSYDFGWRLNVTQESLCKASAPCSIRIICGRGGHRDLEVAEPEFKTSIGARGGCPESR